LLAPDMRQAKVSLDYAEGALKATPMMRQLIAGRTSDTLTLTTGITLEVRSASFRRIRGVTAVAVLADECAFWLSETSSNPDVEILNAARPALATTNGPLIAISSPYARKGALREMYRLNYGADGDPQILVAQGASRDFNPSLSPEVVNRAMARDEAAALAEYGAQFRTDVETFVSMEAVQACISAGVRERGADRASEYMCFVDPSGGSVDSMTLCVSHVEDGQAVLDVIREARPPFSPTGIVAEFAETLAAYKVRTVQGDRYGGMWPREQFARHNVTYQVADKSASQLFVEFLPLVNAGRVRLLDHRRLLDQLVNLERRTSFDDRNGVHLATVEVTIELNPWSRA
jgi:hypothetical protein